LNDSSQELKDTPLFDIQYLINGTRETRLQWNTDRILHTRDTPQSTV